MQNDDAFANGAHIDGAEAYPPRWAAQAAAFRDALGARAQVGVSYGPSSRQTFDIFQPEGVARGTLIFVHGGYWKAFDQSSWSHLAAGALAKGWAVAMPGYDLCPNVRISEITAQIALAVQAIALRSMGPLALAGHSAGGHLVCRMTDPLVLDAETRGRITALAPISPVADLAPLMQTSMNETLRIDAAEAAAESPVNMQPPHGLQVSVWVGADERPVFVEQAQALGRGWGARCHLVEERHHFDVIDALEDPESDLLAALLS
ncbi:alpha/beta hydrolase [Sulfitobacter albidus]|uniref:Alpha/beta hydrolase n=1 Tax=Sulfitobacter albidus TaxID=2829501 RepID=A0A975JE69_9RHOB|nr:alpha/beta hydrolase [Sulfitobacter albidus]QUJ76410.1 alpha/beta hydrolase [Sulfitobacter albidus]